MPLLAGHKQDGRKPFVAMAMPMWKRCAVLVEDTKAEELKFPDFDGNMVTPSGIRTIVLRYASETYPRRYGSGEFRAVDDEVGLDATGPCSWEFRR